MDNAALPERQQEEAVPEKEKTGQEKQKQHSQLYNQKKMMQGGHGSFVEQHLQPDQYT